MIPTALAQYLDVVAQKTIERFEGSYLVAADGCWEWQRIRNVWGYGRFNVGGTESLAHRFSYELHIGPIPDGLVLDHLCRNPCCVNPSHLEPVTTAENLRRGDVARSAFSKPLRAHCPQGHPYDEHNTYWRPDGGRDCRECMRRRSREYKVNIRKSQAAR